MIDPELLYGEGCSPMALDPLSLDLLWGQLNSEDWVEDPDRIYRQIPKWSIGAGSDAKDAREREQLTRDKLMIRAPLRYSFVLQRFLNNPSIIGSLKSLGVFRVRSVHCWNGAEALDWHWDGVEQGDLFVMVYFNGYENWNPQWGGQFRVGSRSLTHKNWLTDPGHVEIYQEHMPEHGKILLCNNQNPKLVHSVSPLLERVNRYTITAGVDLA